MAKTVVKITDPQLDRVVQAEKLQLLYQQSFPAVLASLVTAALLCIILWPVQSHAILLGWLGILTGTSLIRVGLFTRYWRASPSGEATLAWEMPYIATLLLSSLVWGAGAVYIMPVHSELHQSVVFFFLLGMAGGATTVYSAYRYLVLAIVAVVLLPTALWYASKASMLAWGMVTGSVIFFITIIRASKVLALAMHQNLILNHELTNAKEIAEKQAQIDELTGLHNRRAFYDQGQVFVEHCNRNQENLCLILMDIDHFKKINDTRGHAAGDATLKLVGTILPDMLRRSDICARIGGEEFGILLPGTSPEGALYLAEKLRKKVSAIATFYNDESYWITASFGVSCGEDSLDALFKRADDALYEAKEAGRNRVGAQANMTEPAGNRQISQKLA